jgi:hypothetical protein
MDGPCRKRFLRERLRRGDGEHEDGERAREDGG